MKTGFKRLLRKTIGGFSMQSWLLASAGIGVLLTWAIGWEYGLPAAGVVSLYGVAGAWIVDRWL